MKILIYNEIFGTTGVGKEASSLSSLTEHILELIKKIYMYIINSDFDVRLFDDVKNVLMIISSAVLMSTKRCQIFVKVYE